MENLFGIKKNFGFGCMRLPMIGEEVDIEQTKVMVDKFLEAGFNYFDTAHGYLGGKSGLRGRCVQPCRRIYKQKGREGRFFSCQDLSLDVLVKTLCDIPHIRSLKVEGRKKGPHYVYHVITAYRMLLDALGTEDWAHAKKDAESLLEMALGRPTTRARFLP